VELKTDAVVIGAGVVGLAVARELALRGLEVIVLEQEERIGEGSSSRNSEVIHAGIYYEPGSRKARSCVRGRALLYAFLAMHGIPRARCGKLIVGARGDRAVLAGIRQRAERAGVTDLEDLDAHAIHEREPQVQAEIGLFSPSTGIVDSHQLMLALQAALEAAGGHVVTRSPVESGQVGVAQREHRLVVGGSEPAEIRCRILVNAAGLHAREVWQRIVTAASADRAPGQFFAKGHYYAYQAPPPFRHLVYPVPEPGGLGIHATLDLAGQLRFGPDVRWVDRIDYRFDDSERARFVAAIRAYYPGLDETRLVPAYTGIRPKIVGPGAAAADFCLLGPREHGIAGFCSLHGIESPGLTASLAIAEDVAALVLESATDAA
jgi:L-2-hydroxyglutarate oxidase LhgO